ncbi:hypothetical protein IE53DRAFT_50985 [Violaceomyces palustris]|uniref:Uncharacterized protein n=1 Tax=Violaceomyces palustris TaxID=1673888 RepID=A0ACD0P000_9BASI|nr:hypothetical protein IE53DRAFT_50985 [Violaceomyces palustris]
MKSYLPLSNPPPPPPSFLCMPSTRSLPPPTESDSDADLQSGGRRGGLRKDGRKMLYFLFFAFYILCFFVCRFPPILPKPLAAPSSPQTSAHPSSPPRLTPQHETPLCLPRLYNLFPPSLNRSPCHSHLVFGGLPPPLPPKKPLAMRFVLLPFPWEGGGRMEGETLQNERRVKKKKKKKK